MRPITPLVFKGIKPVNMSGVPGVDWDLLVPTDIYVDESYQRDLSAKSMALIRHMVENWSWAKFKAPTCVRVGGKNVCIDGQHTATAAATHGGIAAIPVLIVSAPTTAAQAEAFISHSTSRVVATRGQIHHAALAAGDVEALRLQRIVDHVGLKLVLSPKPVIAYRPGETFAVGTVRQLMKTRGDKLAKDVLSALVQSGIVPISGADIQTADALLCDPEMSEGLDIEKVAALFRDMSPAQQQDAETLSVAKRMPLWKATAAVLCRSRTKVLRRSAVPESNGLTTLSSVHPEELRRTGSFGEPEAGRSALDERRRLHA